MSRLASRYTAKLNADVERMRSLLREADALIVDHKQRDYMHIPFDEFRIVDILDAVSGVDTSDNHRRVPLLRRLLQNASTALKRHNRRAPCPICSAENPTKKSALLRQIRKTLNKTGHY